MNAYRRSGFRHLITSIKRAQAASCANTPYLHPINCADSVIVRLVLFVGGLMQNNEQPYQFLGNRISR